MTPEQPKSVRRAKRVYIRLTLGQKVMLCQKAREQPQSRDLEALRVWATEMFNLPKRPSERSIYNILQQEDKLLKLPTSAYEYKKFADPVLEELDQAIVAGFDAMGEDVSSITDTRLIHRSKFFIEAKFPDLPPEKMPGFSKGWAYRFRQRHATRCLAKQIEALNERINEDTTCSSSVPAQTSTPASKHANRS
ncbi:unnamed protein product [Phytophthora lilii]|uniref:Unnamed protein product n=1 Tax=Phytophthora lilii TaxID=2077276 RepID=A0A9W6TRZ3_9STRA|nr:unnamed protein product [Phytophthora lilii]